MVADRATLQPSQRASGSSSLDEQAQPFPFALPSSRQGRRCRLVDPLKSVDWAGRHAQFHSEAEPALLPKVWLTLPCCWNSLRNSETKDRLTRRVAWHNFGLSGGRKEWSTATRACPPTIQYALRVLVPEEDPERRLGPRFGRIDQKLSAHEFGRPHGICWRGCNNLTAATSIALQLRADLLPSGLSSAVLK